MKESWQRPSHRIIQVVELEEADPVTIGRPEKPESYILERVEVTTFWEQGMEDKARQVVTVRCRKVRADGTPALMPGKLYLRQFTDHGRQLPEWLDLMIITATPRGVNVP